MRRCGLRQIAIACIQANHCLNLGEFCFSQPHIRIQEVADLALPVAPQPPSQRRKPRVSPAYRPPIRPKEIRPQVSFFDRSTRSIRRRWSSPGNSPSTGGRPCSGRSTWGRSSKPQSPEKPIFLWWDGNTMDQEEPPPSATRRKRPGPFLLRGSPTSAFSRKQNSFVFYRALCTILCLQNPAPPQQNPDKKRRGPLCRCPRRTF